MGKKSTEDDSGLIDELKEEVRELVTKIQKHFIAIEIANYIWRSFNRRLECLEEVKSQRGKRRRRSGGSRKAVNLEAAPNAKNFQEAPYPLGCQ
ncbi:unnamed protein product [Heligmosomoides polygyrus]|uniref:Uncharacterized protein n=1 Tax=Heligmosomoides polygyrus TaxID=6339 RepID=A0A183GRC0_HELPZ|nr:unnamed protein product [Heligmosomoides polygyrus]